jgi:hypothetical protein
MVRDQHNAPCPFQAFEGATCSIRFRAMGPIKSTILRLEREIQHEHARALAAMHQAYDHLSASLLTAARERGYLGSDPLGALGHLLAPTPMLNQVGEDTLQLWRTFFLCFRPDEAAFEAAQFQQRAGELNERVNALQPGDRPELPLTVEILQTLCGLWEERHQAISARLDTLISELSTNQAKLGSVELATAHQSDELQRVTQVVTGSLSELNEPINSGEPLGQQVARAFTRYRTDLAASRRHAQGMIAATRRVLEALNAIATRREVPPLPPEAEGIISEVRKLDEARRELENTVRELRGQIAKVEAERHELMEEVAARDRRLSRYEEGDHDKLDERLRLYREAFAALETGGNHKNYLDQVRKIERVITLTSEAETQAARVSDRHVSEIAKCLSDLRAIMVLAEDPKRYRPRLFGNRYEFKTLRGQIAAARDATRDLVEYLDRARWAYGVTVLSKAVPKLRAIFREMVSLVAEWRQKLGDPPPVSITISLDGGSGIVSLPAILASDLETVLKKRSKAGPAATSIAPVLESCVQLYHKTLEQARGEPIARTPAEKRESASQIVARLAAELSHLAALCETTFSEAAAHEFQLSEVDSALLADDHVLRMALHNVDGACEEFAALPNAPTQKFTPLPGRGKDFDKFLTGGRERAAWLEELGMYKILVKDN